MTIYIASHDQEQAIDLAILCEQRGISTTSGWLKVPFLPTECYSDTEKEAIAALDTHDVLRADCLVLISAPHGKKVPGGKFVETGIALGTNKPIFVLGRRENMLIWHPSIKQYDNIDRLLAALVDFGREFACKTDK